MSVTPADNSKDLAMDVQALGRLRQSARQNSPQALKESARQFEALFLNTLLKSMREASPPGEFSGGSDGKLYTAMLDQQLSQTMSQRGIGLADYLLRQMTPATPPATPLASPLAPPVPAPATTPTPPAPRSIEPAVPAPAPALPRSLRDRAAPMSVSSLVKNFRSAMAAPAEAAARKTGLPAAFILGQAALESGWGRRQIPAADGRPSFNLFALKAGANWKGRVSEVRTTEYRDGVAQKVVARFRAYDSYEQAFGDYARMLTQSPRYRSVLANGQTVAGFAQGMQQAGYATDPAYAAKLARVIGRTLSA